MEENLNYVQLLAMALMLTHCGKRHLQLAGYTSRLNFDKGPTYLHRHDTGGVVAAVPSQVSYYLLGHCSSTDSARRMNRFG